MPRRAMLNAAFMVGLREFDTLIDTGKNTTSSGKKSIACLGSVVLPTPGGVIAVARQVIFPVDYKTNSGGVHADHGQIIAVCAILREDDKVQAPLANPE
ncbi:hypothetical protein ES703_123087 [subsurface metagenome]